MNHAERDHATWSASASSRNFKCPGALALTMGASTMAFCPPGSFDQIFLGGLTNAMGYRLEGGNLLIDMLYESGTMTFAPAS